MWNELKQWLLERGERPRSRRTSPAHFRGQFESLESRSMLSASYANVANVDFEVRVVAVVVAWELEAPIASIAAWQTGGTIGIYRDAAPWETLPPPKFVSGGSSGVFGFNEGGPRFHLKFTQQVDAGLERTDAGGGDFAEDRLGGNVKGGLSDAPIRATAPSESTAAENDHQTSLIQVFHNAGVPRPPLPPGVAGTMASYFSSLTPSATATSPTASSLERSSSVQDRVFGTYSPNSLLLAADSEAADNELDQELGDKLDSDEEESGDRDEARHSLFDETAHAALDALDRERQAIDAVLAELHEVKLLADEDASQPSTTEDESNSSAERDQPFWNAGYDPALAPQNAYEADGGMVLLEPTGDANSNAYDLTVAYLPSLNGDRDTPLAVEASVGIYQAMDVGASELLPADRGNLPIAQPSANVQPSVSAENAPAKKSEQPS